MDIWKSMYDGGAGEQVDQPVEPKDDTVDTTQESGVIDDENAQQAQEVSTDAEPYNPFISEALKMPESFDDQEQELEWLRTKYSELHGQLTNKEFYDKLYETYRDQFIAREEEAQQILQTHKALKENPREYIRQFFPETLAELGVSPVLKDEEVAAEVDKALQKEFGEDYKNLYDPNDLAPFKGNTVTRQIFNRGNELHAEFQKQNEKNRQIFDNYTAKVAQGKQPIDEAAVSDYLDSEYAKLEKQGLSREDYDTFVQELKEYHPTVEDFWKMKNVDKLVEKAKQEAFEQGKKATLKGISAITSPAKREPASEKTSSQAYEDWTKAQLKKGMGFAINY